MVGPFSITFHPTSEMPEKFTTVFSKETEALMPKSIRTILNHLRQNTSGI